MQYVLRAVTWRNIKKRQNLQSHGSGLFFAAAWQQVSRVTGALGDASSRVRPVEPQSLGTQHGLLLQDNAWAHRPQPCRRTAKVELEIITT
jgi:hypothetical protein